MGKMYISHLSDNINKLNTFKKDITKIITSLENKSIKTLNDMIDLKMYKADLYRIERNIKDLTNF